MADSALLEISDVETCYGLSQVLFGMSFAIGRGEMVTLMGRNGMGKTTTVRSIMGLTRAMAGSIRFDGREIRGWMPIRWPSSALGWCRRGGRFSQPDGAGKSGCDRGEPERRRRSVDAGQGLWAIPPARSASPTWQPALRRRAADAGDRPCADDQPAPADPR